LDRALALFADYATKLPNFAPELIGRMNRPFVHFVKLSAIRKLRQTRFPRPLIIRRPNDFPPHHHDL
jgi:hypothetical protein